MDMSATMQTVSVEGGIIRPQACQLYKHYTFMIDKHHVIPHSWWLAAGKEVNTPMYNLCPNCHYEVHVAIDGLIKGQNIRQLSPRCQSLARRALAGAEQFSLTPALTL